MLGMIAGGQHTKGNVLPNTPVDFAGGEDPCGIGIDQHFQHHAGIVGGVAPSIPQIGCVRSYRRCLPRH